MLNIAAMKTLNHQVYTFFLFLPVLVLSPLDLPAQQTAFAGVHNTGVVQTEPASEPYKSEFFRVQREPQIIVKTLSGDISVIENSQLRGVQVDLYVERSFSLWSGTRSLDNYRIIMQQRGNQIIASVEDRHTGTSRRGGDIRFHFVVQVPAKSHTELRTNSGKINLEGVEGVHFLQNHSGDLAATNVMGEVRLVSTSGNLDLQGLHGNVFGKTVSGDIYVEGSSGEVRMRSISGNIYASDMDGTLISATTSGNITADFKRVSQGIYLEAISGDIDVYLPPDIGYEIVGRAMHFDFSGLHQSDISDQRQNFRERRFVIREGDMPVQLSTLSGLIRISETN